MPRSRYSLGAIAFICFAALLGTIVQLVTHRVFTHLEANFGYTPNPEATREFLSQLEQPTFAEAGEDAIKQAKGVDTFLYRFVDKAHRSVYGTPWECLNQGSAGTCISFAFSLGARTGQATDWAIGRLPMPPPAVASEPVYGGARVQGMGRSSQPGGDGATGSGAARWIAGKCRVPGVGGILYRQVYGPYDLRQYSIPKSREWGASGVPDELAREAFKHKALAVAQVNTWDELCASVERGSPVVLCSSVGYGRADGRQPVRDADGFLERGTPWSHAMLVWAVRHKANGSRRDGGLIQNSWSAKWCSGPKWPSDQPDGSFWASRQNIEAALQQGDCWAIGGVDGFRYQDIHNGNWLEPAGQ
jgi:hypothetical protein